MGAIKVHSWIAFVTWGNYIDKVVHLIHDEIDVDNMFCDLSRWIHMNECI